MLRYEKMGGLNESWGGLSDAAQAHCLECECHLGTRILDGVFPPVFDYPKGLQPGMSTQPLNVSQMGRKPGAVASMVLAPSDVDGMCNSTGVRKRKRLLSTLEA